MQNAASHLHPLWLRHTVILQNLYSGGRSFILDRLKQFQRMLKLTDEVLQVLGGT